MLCLSKKKLLLAAGCYALLTAQAQQPAFFHLGTAEGLSDNCVTAVQRDRNGILWIGTTEGLNSYDGYTITPYLKEKYPALGSNHIYQLTCDNANRLWLRTDNGKVTMLDERRRFHSITTSDTGKAPIRFIIKTNSRGVLILKGNKHYVAADNQTDTLLPLAWNTDTLIPSHISFCSPVDEDKMLFCGSNRMVLVDYARLKVVANIPFPDVHAAAKLNEQELIALCASGNSLYRVSLTTGSIIQEYKNLPDQYGRAISNNLREICPLPGNRFIITSRFSGAYLFDPSMLRVERWHHNPVDDHSIGGNNTFIALYDTSGYLFLTTRTSGLHYFNTKQPVATVRSFFEEKGHIFDGFVQSITMDRQQNLWLGTQDRLIKWDRVKNESTFIDYRLPDGASLHGTETIRALLFDQDDNLWIGSSRYGIIVLDKTNRTIRHLQQKGANENNTLPSNWINALCRDQQGNIWIGTPKGVCKVNALTGQAERLHNDPILAPLASIPCHSLWAGTQGQLWIGTTRGAWCYTAAANTLQQYSQQDGLSHNTVLAFNEDKAGNIYIGTADGLTILNKEGHLQRYNRTNGLRNDKCEGILQDEEGFMWIGNGSCLLRFDPSHNSFAAYEEGHGFSHPGFRMRSCYKSTGGELFWGSDKGLNYFFPRQLNMISIPLQPAVHAVYTTDTSYHLTRFDSFVFPWNKTSYTFHLTAGELTGSRKVQFLYRLNGYETTWNKPVAYGQAIYNRLPPGRYHFELQATRDGKTWYQSPYKVAITVLAPWWQQVWFRLLCAVIVLGSIGLLYRYSLTRRKAAEVEKMLDYFSHAGYAYSSVADILWDICRNCISGLGFEDCVIYLLDEEKQVLIQHAAYGPKNPAAFEILNPIQVPLGKGIVGHVADTGKSEIIPDTSKDKRYIVDDENRLSEITVPLIHEGRVIGVIDSEHCQRNFFTRSHLQALQTIASICSAKISKAMAMDAMKKSRLEVMELNVKMMESRFLNLRLQMNPHFLFNALSSIQNLIVSQQTTSAYKYLTLFSNFLRSLLNHAEKNFITLDEELSILRMYIELEALRFDRSFRYEIKIEEGLTNDEVLVPSLVIQPFAENAIWHGLMQKRGDKKLSISFANSADEYLTCTIEDNGIGREKAAAIGKRKISSMVHESKGIHIIRERLQLLQQKTGKPAKVEIEDLFDELHESSGTRIIITIPYYNPEEV